MRSRPETFSVVAFLVSVVFLCLSYGLYRLGADEHRGLVLAAALTTFAALTFQLFTSRIAHFLATVPVQFVAVFIIIGQTQPTAPLANVMLVFTLVLNVSIRLPPKYSLPINLFAVTIPALSAIGHLSTVMVIVPLVAIGIVLAGCVMMVVIYRELLVDAGERTDMQRRTIGNISDANESFVQHLPEMRKESAEQERLRITRELHDSLGYAMTNIVVLMNAAGYLFDSDPDKVKEYCRKTKELASGTIEETRRILYMLRSIGGGTSGNPSIFFDKLCRDFQEATGITTECHPGNLVYPLPERVFNTLLRTAQVAFIDALKHGKASRIRLHFWVSESDLRMAVWNSTDRPGPRVDGGSEEGIGLQGVRERLSMLGGEMRKGSTLDGYVLSIMIPAKELQDGTYEGHRR